MSVEKNQKSKRIFYFGELALLRNEPRGANVLAVKTVDYFQWIEKSLKDC